MKKAMKSNRGFMYQVSNVFGLIRSSSGPGARKAVAALALTTAASVLAAALIFPSKIMADDDEVTTFTVDVATDGAANFQNNVNPSQNAEAFFPGDTFLLGGTIYPGGTLPMGKADNDPNAAGGIGKYRLRGTYTTDLANFELAVAHLPGAAPDLAFGTEMFSLLDNRTIIMTDGTWPNVTFSAQRVVLGGTGRFREVIGEVHEENIGENKTGFCNLRVTFKLRKVDDGHRRR